MVNDSSFESLLILPTHRSPADFYKPLLLKGVCHINGKVLSSERARRPADTSLLIICFRVKGRRCNGTSLLYFYYFF
jgi:hypothetical protein